MGDFRASAPAKGVVNGHTSQTGHGKGVSGSVHVDLRVNVQRTRRDGYSTISSTRPSVHRPSTSLLGMESDRGNHRETSR